MTLSQSSGSTSCFNLPEAPCFRPTKEEWADPIKYLTNIRQAVEPYGLCKIVPPADWKPPFALDIKNLQFPTRKQLIHELQDRTLLAQKQQAFSEKYEAFARTCGCAPKKVPSLYGEAIDLFRLFSAVQKRGGSDKVTSHKKWMEVADLLQVSDGHSTAGHALRQLYQKYLGDFEKHEYPQQPSDTTPASSRTTGRRENRKESSSKGCFIDYAGTEKQSVKACQSVEPPRKKRKTDKKPEKGQYGKADSSPCSDRVPMNIDTLLCELCAGGAQEEHIILCDRCDRGFHTFCLSPPLEEVPEGDWICPLCLKKDSEKFAFKPGQTCSWDQFKEVADRFRDSYWGGPEAASEVSWQELEAAFWRTVENAEEHIEVLYGADLDSSTYGSGFPKQGHRADSYSLDGWNLNNLPRRDGLFSSALRFIEDDVSGVIVPWLYIGMMFSAFCWHVEDHLFYSANFLHYGAPKRWYSVPFHGMKDFEATFQQTVPQQFAAQPDLLFQLITTLSPRVLTEHKVPICTVVQEQGDMIVSFPGAYHAGFNHGFNCAEAVNFVPADWFQYAGASVARYRSFRKPSVISQEELLLQVAAKDPSPHSALWIERELRRVIEEEAELRYRCWERGVKTSAPLCSAEPKSSESGDEEAEDAECCVCHQYVYLSALECECIPNRKVCLHHAEHLCDCPAYKNRMLYRYSLIELEAIWKKSAALAATAEGVMAAATEKTLTEKTKADKTEARTVGMDVFPGTEQESAPTAAAVEHTDLCKVDLDFHTAKEQAAEKEVWEPGPAVEQLSLPAGTSRDGNQAAAEPAGGAADAACATLATGSGPTSVASKDCVVKEELDANEEGTTGLCDANRGTAEARKDSAQEDWVLHSRRDGETAGDKSLQQACKGEDSKDQLGVADAAAKGQLQPLPALHYSSDVGTLQKKYEVKSKAWQKKAEAVLKQGNVKLSEVDHLLQEAQQFVWGLGEVEGVCAMQEGLRKIRTWVGDVTACIRGKPSLKQAISLVAWQPPPVTVPGFLKLQNAVRQSQHVQQEVNKLLENGLAHASIAELEAQVKAASKLAIAIPEISQLQAHIRSARSVQATISSVLAKFGKQAVSVVDLKALQAQTLSVAANIPELVKLQAAVEAGEQWQARAEAALAVKPTLEELQRLLDDGDKLPATVPELATLRTAAHNAVAWAKEADAVMASPNTTLMRGLLHAGERLAVKMPQVEVLHQHIRKREWEDSTKQVLQGKCTTMSQAQDLLREAQQMGAKDCEMVLELQQRVDAAAVWSGQADKALQGARQSQAASTLDHLKQLLASGQKLGMKLEQLGALQEQVNKCSSWQAAAGKLLARVGSSPPPSCTAIRACVQMGEELALDLPELAQLKAILQTADEWAAKAQALLQQPFGMDLASIQSLESAGLQLGIAVENMKGLMGLHSALQWNQEVKDKLAVVVKAGKAAPGGCDGDGEMTDAAHMPPEGVQTGKDALIQSPESKPDRGASEGGGAAAASDAVATADDHTAGDNMAGGSGAAAAIVEDVVSGKPSVLYTWPDLPWAARPELAVAMDLIQKASDLHVDQHMLSLLRSAVNMAKAWQQRMSKLMHKEHDSAPINLAGAQQLLHEGRELPFKMPQVITLEKMLEERFDWEKQAEKLLERASSLESEAQPTLDEINALRDQAHALGHPALLSRLSLLATNAEAWLERCKHAIVKKGSGQRLNKCLQAMSTNLASALAAFNAIAIIPAKDLGLSSPNSGARRSRRRKVHVARDEDGPHKLHCLCQMHSVSDPNMVQCDTCKDWYHTKCVGLTPQAAGSSKTWGCPLCSWGKDAVGGGGKQVQLPAVLQKTNAPSLAQLEELLAGKPRQVQLAEEQLLEEVIKTAKAWQAMVQAALSSHIQKRAEDAGAGRESSHSKLLLHESKLRELVKQAVALELDTRDTQEQALQLLCREGWRTRALATWGTGNKPSWEHICKIVEDAAACGVTEDMDVLAQEALELHVQGKEWMTRRQELLASVKVAARTKHDKAAVAQLVQQAASLAAQAPQLGLRVDKELQELKEAAKPYCLCEQLYDELRPMLSCDYCENWFHYDCVGLESPALDEPASAPEDFCCPACSFKVGVPYQCIDRMPAAFRQQFKPLQVTAKAAASARKLVQGAAAAAQCAAPASNGTAAGLVGRAAAGSTPAQRPVAFEPGQALPVTPAVLAAADHAPAAVTAPVMMPTYAAAATSHTLGCSDVVPNAAHTTASNAPAATSRLAVMPGIVSRAMPHPLSTNVTESGCMHPVPNMQHCIHPPAPATGSASGMPRMPHRAPAAPATSLTVKHPQTSIASPATASNSPVLAQPAPLSMSYPVAPPAFGSMQVKVPTHSTPTTATSLPAGVAPRTDSPAAAGLNPTCKLILNPTHNPPLDSFGNSWVPTSLTGGMLPAAAGVPASSMVPTASSGLHPIVLPPQQLGSALPNGTLPTAGPPVHSSVPQLPAAYPACAFVPSSKPAAAASSTP